MYKKIAKRTFVLFFVFTLLLSTSIFADSVKLPTANEVVTAEALEKSDTYIQNNLDALLDEAITTDKPSSDILTTELASPYGEKYDIPVYVIDTTDTVKLYDNDSPVQALTYVVNIPSLTDVIAFGAGDNNTNEGDQTSSVRAYLTTYYTTSGNTIVLTKVSGYYVRLDSQVKVVSQNVVYSCTGPTSGLGLTQIGTKYPSVAAPSWSYNTGFSPVITPSGSTSVGANYNLTLQHISGGSTWKFTVPNVVR